MKVLNSEADMLMECHDMSMSGKSHIAAIGRIGKIVFVPAVDALEEEDRRDSHPADTAYAMSYVVISILSLLISREDDLEVREQLAETMGKHISEKLMFIARRKSDEEEDQENAKSD
jgi:hypothetical protein